ncbi:MAG: GDP-L-fucose synthase [Desulfamplus sp.]|nr:GDP-L-fucose synthase [Desulfamplus sp.]
MDKNSKIFIAGATGMVGSAIIRNLLKNGFNNLVGSFNSNYPKPDIFVNLSKSEKMIKSAGPLLSSKIIPKELSELMPKELSLVKIDLTSQNSVSQFFEKQKPDYVFLAAAKVGGINANNTFPAEFIRNNLTIQTNVIHSAYQAKVKRLLFLGSSCIYPKFAPQPMKEEHLLTGVLEPTNEPYAISKIAGIKMCESYNRQYGTKFIAVMPTNLYGPNDNFDLANSHVIPALIRKFHEAKLSNSPEVVVWGTGSARREFLHVDEMADASVFVMNLDDSAILHHFLSYPKPCFVNVGAGIDFTIKEVAEKIKEVVGYEGKLSFDTSKPDGTPQKLLDINRLNDIGWKSQVALSNGLFDVYEWYKLSLNY